MSRRETLPTLQELTDACRNAGSRGWSREQVRLILEANRARWEKGYLTEVPAHLRATLLSDLEHHPSWWLGRRHFCGRLRRLGCSYGEVAEAAERLGRLRPSMMSEAERAALLDQLQDADTDLVRELCKVRAAAQALRKRRAA